VVEPACRNSSRPAGEPVQLTFGKGEDLSGWGDLNGPSYYIVGTSANIPRAVIDYLVRHGHIRKVEEVSA